MERERELVLVESGLCWPDYWQGTPGVGLFVYPDNTTTVGELKAMLLDEISQIWEHIVYTFLDDFQDLESLEISVSDALYKFFHGADLSRKPFSANEFPTDEDSEGLPWIVNLEMRDV